jgi:hypothetical protein
MKKILLALTASSILCLSSLFAGDAKECKKCAGDKEAKCTCKEMKGCDESKACPKAEKDAKPAPSPEKK